MTLAQYLTVDQIYGPQELKEKGSRFIAYLYPVNSVDEAETAISALRKKYYDATHVCFAFRLKTGVNEYSRCNDDGEPSGTAGLPILNVIKSQNYFNVLVAVIRYYGGTKLGTGGLARAYGGTARIVLESSVPLIVIIKKKMHLDFPYSLTGDVMKVIRKFSADILHQEFTPQGNSLLLDIPITNLENMKRVITDVGSGKLHLEMVSSD